MTIDTKMNVETNREFVETFWHDEVMDSLIEYIRIPNKSPMFDPEWEAHGHMETAVNHMLDWVNGQSVPGLIAEIHKLPGKTPTLYLELEGERDDTILIYGHLDKQPEFSGWDEGLAPWDPVVQDDRLYGRGGADDGYAIYSAITAIKSLQSQALAIPRIVIIIEASEESGSPDLAAYMDLFDERLGTPGLVIALDSTCGNYDQLWVTTSLRGMIIGDLKVQVLDKGVHSGAAGGIVASSFRVLRNIISRLEDETTGTIKPSFLHDQIPGLRRDEAIKAGQILKHSFADMYPFAGHGKPVSDDPTELILNNTWAASMEVTGLGGAPSPADAGNVMRPETTARIALRLPPTIDAHDAADKLTALLIEKAPHGAEVSFVTKTPNPGWHAPLTSPALELSLQKASMDYFGKEAVSIGCGGSIPFMEFLAKKLPHAQFVVTGVLGPHSNAHGPNEFLHLPCVKKLTASVASLIFDWGQNLSGH